ncbi:MAG: hypothetical protein JWN12_177 [Candidatus Saccharibacteria bacterium]|nr:hypothetical protein [Candidatus Saccharibacteria bacterium]
MNEAKLTYQVRNAAQHQHDVEQIFAAIGAYENEHPFHTVQTATIDEPVPGTVIMTYVQTINDTEDGKPAWFVANMIRNGIEKHFSAEDKARLAKYFATIAIK